MDFLSSQTAQNLARSVAGESQARSRYTVYAGQARKEKQEFIARIFEQTADNEKVHAQEFLEMLVKLAGGPVHNIDLTAGYPYDLGSTADNLQFAAEGEGQEHDTIYPEFARIAREEGYADAAKLWENIAAIEGLHHNIFLDAHKQYTDCTLYQKDKPVVWRCLNCGHIVEALEPWKVCPVCHKDMGWAMGYVDERQVPKQK
ncbi:MAG: rubrerythrin family protein [Oscillospiraceae bacterium]|nr:rubrerythrin family protein [Oscillospiraceae bacterium]